MAGTRKEARGLLALALAVIVPGASLLWALDWPVETPAPISWFGTAAAGGFSEGIVLDAQASLVKAVEEGEVAFAVDARSGAKSALPSTLGSWIAVEHPRGLVGVYAGLSEGSVSSYLAKVKKDAILGTTGRSGWARAESLEFRLFDRGAGRWVNPLLLLPPVADRTQPLIRAAYLSRDGRSWPLGETKSLPQGRYTVLVDALDPLGPAPAAPSPAPYYVRLVVDGAKVAELTFDIAAASDGSLRVSSTSPRSYGECYVEGGRIALGEKSFARGRSVVQVLVRDYAGNERQASWSISLE